MTQRDNVEAIGWRDWSEEAFLAARQEDKPVLLTLAGAWCHWCHVMDDTSYSDARVIGLVNSRFIPVRVDVDQRPDIARRYNQGSYPSMAFLNHQGELVAGRGYTPPEQMVRLLEQVRDAYPDSPDLPDARASRPAPAGYGDSREPPETRVLQRLQELYDPEFGGFGREPKQPPWEALRFLLARYSRSGDRQLLKMVVDTLDAMRNGLYDQHDQGFFRYSVSRDWRVPHYEKMLVTNANLAVAYLEAYQVTGKTAYKQAAVGSLDYLSRYLQDPARGAFYGSQDAGEEYYRLPWKDREQAAKPTIDRACYTGWNALAAASLVKAFGALGSPSYLQSAARVLDLVWRESWSPEQGLSRVVGGARRQPPALEDHLYVLRALLDLYQATGHGERLQQAVTLANQVQALFAAPDGGFYDISDTGIAGAGVLTREKSLLENSLLAEALATLSCLTGEEEFLSVARGALEAFREAAPGRCYLGPEGSRRMEQDEEQLFLPAGSAWGRAWDLLDGGPVHLVLVGSAADAGMKSLLKAALRGYAPHRAVQLLDPERDRERVTTLGFPAATRPALYACMNGMCLAPLATAKEVRELATARPWATL